MSLELIDLVWTPPGAGSPVLDHVNLRIDAGERVVISGRSGTGKSSLLRCATFLEAFEHGEVRFDGAPVVPQDVPAFRRAVGYVAQRPAAVGRTVRDNLEFPRRLYGDEAMPDDEIDDLLARLGLEGLSCERRFEELSGGEQQRLVLIRALSVRPRFLLLDEPTSSLDPERLRVVEALLDEWMDEDPAHALVWVTHDIEQGRRVGARQIEFRNGKAIEVG